MSSAKSNDLRGLKAPVIDAGGTGLSGLPMWRWLYWICLAALGFFVLLVGRDLISRARRTSIERSAEKAKKDAKSWQRLKSQAEKAVQKTTPKNAKSGDALPWAQVIQLYELLSGQVFDALEEVYPVGTRSYSREELERMLVVERQMPQETWDRASKLLEFAELVRFASSAGAISESRARDEAAQWVQEGQALVQLISKK